jgi:HicA toxin of bacterial toxin-antitoxin,
MLLRSARAPCLHGRLSSNVSRQTSTASAPLVPISGTIHRMKRKHQRTLEAIFTHPTSANIQWKDVEALFRELGAEISEREGSRVAVVLFSEVRVFHRPHPSPNTDKGAIVSIRRWLEQHGAVP